MTRRGWKIAGRVHTALADATDPGTDPDRRAWHRANAAPALDEAVAGELERSADRAQARGGLAAAAAFLERATALTPDPAARARRALAAARALHEAGAFDAALGLLGEAQAGPLDELARAHVVMLQARIAFAQAAGDATAQLLEAAKRLEPLDAELAHETYLEALSVAMFGGRVESRSELLKVAEAARAVAASPAPAGPRALLLDGLALLLTEGHAAAAPTLKRAVRAFCAGPADGGEESLRWLWLGCIVAFELWDDEAWEELSTRQL